MIDHITSWAGLSFAQVSKDLNKQLQLAGIIEAEQEVRVLMAAVFGPDVWQQVADPAQIPDKSGLTILSGLTQRRLTKEPLSQILGEKGFWTLDLWINRHVLTPRADSEILIETALKITKDQTMGNVLDLGTGSGALLLAFLSERANWSGTGIDISPEALKMAQQNAKKCGLSEQTDFINCDWAGLGDASFNLILSNPPYIASEELAALEPEVVQFEPNIALDGGKDGLDAYRILAKNLRRWLRPGGTFVLEIGHNQAEAVTELLAAETCYIDLKVHQDLGRRDRAIAGALHERIRP